ARPSQSRLGSDPGRGSHGGVEWVKCVTACCVAGSRGYRRCMARPLRPQVPGGIYQVTSKGNRDEWIYVDGESRREHLGLCTLTVERYGWFCDAFCQMGNHYHLLVRTPEPNISAGMQYLNARYAEWFNWRHGYNGHLFKGRFSSKLVETDEYLFETARYIVLNPVRAGVCRHPLDWPWSSYAATIGTADAPPF